MISIKKVTHQDYILYRLIEYSTIQQNSSRKKTGRKSTSSLARASRNIKDIVKHNISHDSAFITLTYAENMQDYDRAQKDFNIFIKKLQYHTKQKIQYLAIKELQKRGAIHYHILAFNWKETRIKNIWKYGKVDVKQIDDLQNIDKVANYMSKYLGKSGDIALSKKMYFTSRGLKKTIIEKMDNLDYNQIHKNAIIINKPNKTMIINPPH